MSFKEEFIAKYGEEAWTKKCERSRLCHKQKYDNDPAFRERRRAKSNKRCKTNKEYLNAVALKRYRDKLATDPTFKEHTKQIAEKNKEKAKSIMGDAYDFVIAQMCMMSRHPADDLDKYILENLTKEAVEIDREPRLVNEDFLYDCFVENCKYGLFYGNLQVIKYFVPLMCIKVHSGIELTDKNIEMIKVFNEYRNTLNKKPIEYSFKFSYIRPDQKDDVDMNMKCMLLYNLSADFMHKRSRYATDKKLY
jgi:hypothetical protein